MKPAWLECGGKSPNMIFADCDDLEAAADAAAFGIWYDQGEVCTANSRLLVEESIKDRFLDLLKARAGNWQPGDPLNPATPMGAIVERDLTSGIQDVFPLPVLGVLNERPFGPCFNTRVDINKLEAAILAFMEDDEEETKHAEGTKSKLS